MIENYLKTGEHKDKAGAYAVQGYSGVFVEKLSGNYSTVIGIPTHKLYKILHEENLI
jgi:septum formation protein